MIAFPHCKINLGLRVLEKRADGFHNIETIFYPVQWHDAVEVIPCNKFSFELKGILLEGNAEDNLCVKAYRLLEKEYKIPPIKMCLLKNIPAGAGLGGGSADAAFTFKLLNDLFELKISNAQLKNIASQLGSDCAFFIDGKPSIAKSKGEELTVLNLDLSSYQIIIIHPGIHVNTSWAYAQIDAASFQKINSINLVSVIEKPIEEWNKLLHNDFEEVIFKKYPQIEELKKLFYSSGAIYSAMSGSGSAVFGIFEKKPIDFPFQNSMKYFSGKL